MTTEDIVRESMSKRHASILGDDLSLAWSWNDEKLRYEAVAGSFFLHCGPQFMAPFWEYFISSTSSDMEFSANFISTDVDSPLSAFEDYVLDKIFPEFIELVDALGGWGYL
jgi:hypothetical protein